MKIFLRILYGIFIIVISYFMVMFSMVFKYEHFIESEMERLNNEFNRDEYIAAQMTYNTGVYKFLTDPVYLAVSNEDKLEFGIYQFSTMNNGIENYNAYFYFKDFGNETIKSLTEHESYKKHPYYITILFEIYYDNYVSPVTYVMESHYLHQRPVVFASINENEDGLQSYIFYETIDDKKYIQSHQTINKINISVIDGFNEDEKYPLLEINHDDNSDNLGVNIVKDGVAPNFNGNISYHLLSYNYNNENKIGVRLIEQLNSFNYVIVRTLVIYFSIVALITFLLFFFKPLYIKILRKKRQKSMLHDK